MVGDIDRRTLLATAPALALGACATPGAENTSISPVAAVAFDGDSPAPGDWPARMAHYGVPGLSIALLRGRYVEIQTFGVRGAGTSSAVTVATTFQAASLSKPITAIGALMLVDSGVIGLDDDIRPHLAPRAIPFAPGVPAGPVALRALLSHTAGVNVPSFPGFAPGEPVPSLADILDGTPVAKTPRIEVSTPPGTHVYSGGGYALVEQLIETLSGESFIDFMQRRVFAPLGLGRTSYEPTPDERIIAGGHDWIGAPRDPAWLFYPQHAAASLWSTPAELAALLGNVADAYRGQTGRLLTPMTAQAMLTEIVPGMGLGFGVEGAGTAKVASHAGWNRGYRSFAAVFPETGDGVVVMANGDRGHELAQEAVRGAARAFNWPAFAPERLSRVHWSAETTAARVGRYTFADAGFDIEVADAGDHLSIITARGTYDFYPIDSDTMVAIEDGERARFSAEGLAVWGMQARRTGGAR